MEQKYGLPWRKVSFFGLEGMEEALLTTATFFRNRLMLDRAKEIIRQEKKKIFGPLIFYKRRLQGKTAAIYMGGAAKALALIKTFKLLGMETVLVGTQSGKRDDYAQLMAFSCGADHSFFIPSLLLVIEGFNRIVFKGTLRPLCFALGMQVYLSRLKCAK
ncbi:MAG: Nitrogenase MoFe cofactor biosynthesis protein [Methanothrix harundinacea]|uniref:Nitrogenase MoFe cofactor biosynthesis protein n=1 Tax=Methanothrix harundinacea TaxID=301375 RepID=A0A101FRY2_9EURY|nr:MAG: Nitrogenase MoFe cofactor biosynthesis protein [Methanothrix harundinacea]